MFTVLSVDTRREIADIYSRERHNSVLFLFNNVPQRRLERAIRKYATSLNDRDSVILLYDGSAFGTGSMGFILTPEYLYYRDLVDQGETLISEIMEITFDPRARPEASLIVRTTNGEFQIGVWNTSDSLGDSTLRVLDETISLLTNRTGESPDDSSPSKPTRREVICAGCGARNANNEPICTYCGSFL